MQIDIHRRKLDEILFQALRAIHDFGLTYEAIYLLQYLRRQSPAPMSTLAGEMAMPISTVTRLVDRLQQRDLVARVKDDRDKRIIRVLLRPAGQRIVKAVETHTYDLIAKNMTVFEATDFQAFLQTAVHLHRILGSKAP